MTEQISAHQSCISASYYSSLGCWRMAQLQIPGRTRGLLIALAPAVQKEPPMYMCVDSRQIDSFALEIKRLSWVKWDKWIDPKSSKTASKYLKHCAL